MAISLKRSRLCAQTGTSFVLVFVLITYNVMTRCTKLSQFCRRPHELDGFFCPFRQARADPRQ